MLYSPLLSSLLSFYTRFFALGVHILLNEIAHSFSFESSKFKSKSKWNKHKSSHNSIIRFVASRDFRRAYKNVVLRLPNSSQSCYFSPAVFGVAITINFKYIFELKFPFKQKNNNNNGKKVTWNGGACVCARSLANVCDRRLKSVISTDSLSWLNE